MYKPEYLNEWQHPNNYLGATWEGWYGSSCGRSRDSEALERSNYAAMLKVLKAIPEPDGWKHDDPCFLEVRENHWAVGWVEWIAINPQADEYLQAADEIAKSLEDYPIIDDDSFWQEEQSEADQVWANCYDRSERVKYIRENRNQFEFHNFSDLIGSVRGDYFAGYANELIY